MKHFKKDKNGIYYSNMGDGVYRPEFGRRDQPQEMGISFCVTEDNISVSSHVGGDLAFYENFSFETFKVWLRGLKEGVIELKKMENK